MIRSCPPPVDWLDYLDGESEPQLSQHLQGCRSCEVLVESLRTDVPAAVPASWSQHFTERTDAVWHHDRPSNAEPAEFWFSASDFDLDALVGGDENYSETSDFQYHDVDRILLLVITAPDDDIWIDVVPVLSDVESATETDLVFSSDENTLDAPWRALFANQLRIAREQLDTRVGNLSEYGASVLLSALAGDVNDARWGVPLQHADDPRGRLDDEFEQALRRLRTPWLLLHDVGDSDEGTVADDDGQMHIASLVAPDLDEPSQAKVFWLTPVGREPSEFALAAASSATAEPGLWMVQRASFKLAGKLDVDWKRGLLVFIVSATSTRHAVRIRLFVSAAGRDYKSKFFVPATNTTVLLAEGVTTAEVDRLGVEVLS